MSWFVGVSFPLYKMIPRRLLALVAGNLLLVSKPALALNWVQSGAPNTNWTSVASSVDGTKLVAATSGIYTVFFGMLFD
jgi:hypothetical protein